MRYQINRVAVAAAAAIALFGLLASPTTAEARLLAKGPNCGATIARPGGGNWHCTFADEFAGTALNTSKWVAQLTSNSGYQAGDDCYVNTPNNVSVANGLLSLTARREAAPFTCVSPFGNYTTQNTAGSVSTWGKFSQAYGRFEIRAKFPAAKIAGLQSALWLYPQYSKYGAWPSSGEIDIAETYSQYPDRAIPYIHYVQTAYDPTVTNTNCLINDVSALHTYAAVWTPSSITITYDGKTCLVHNWNPAPPLTGSAPFDQPFIVVLTQALGIGTNAFDPATTPMPATTQVDYVHVWA